MIHFYTGDDDDDEPEMEDCRVIDISDDEPIIRRLEVVLVSVLPVLHCGILAQSVQLQAREVDIVWAIFILYSTAPIPPSSLV